MYCLGSGAELALVGEDRVSMPEGTLTSLSLHAGWGKVQRCGVSLTRAEFLAVTAEPASGSGGGHLCLLSTYPCQALCGATDMSCKSPDSPSSVFFSAPFPVRKLSPSDLPTIPLLRCRGPEATRVKLTSQPGLLPCLCL